MRDEDKMDRVGPRSHVPFLEALELWSVGAFWKRWSVGMFLEREHWSVFRAFQYFGADTARESSVVRVFQLETRTRLEKLERNCT